MCDPVNMSHEIFDLAKTREGSHKISDVTGSNSGYWVLETALSVNPNYNGLLCAHYLPADRADSLEDTMDHHKSKNPDHLRGSIDSSSLWWYR